MNHLSRRDLLRFGLGSALGAALALPSRARAAGDRPNFLFINIDDLAWNAMGFTGRFPFLKTPNIDRIAREGVDFKNAFVTISLCSPSRACSLTGCYAHKHDVRTNEGRDSHPGLPTYPQVLQEAGYATAHVGKWHMRPTAEPRPGFDYWLSFRGQGVYTDPTLNENGREFQAKGYMTDILSDYAVAWLKQARDKPFCLNLWHKAVHGPFTPPDRDRNAFLGETLPQPPNWDDDYADKPPWIRRSTKYGARREPWQASEGMPVPERIPPYPWNGRDRNRMNYLRSIQAIDEGLGRIFDLLEAQGQLDNTCIIFTSDNGFFLGEHRRGDKRLAYEESMRIPLLVRFPKRAKPGTAREEMVLNIDVAPTLIDLAGEPVPGEMQGRSLAPLLRGGTPRWRKSFLYEYFEEAWLPGIPTMLAVRTPQWKYITYPDRPGEGEELYDLVHDPIEMHNLAQDPAHARTLGRMRAELKRLKREAGYDDPVPPRMKILLTLALSYAMTDLKDGVLPDHSGHGWDARVRGKAPESAATGLRFTGEERIGLEPLPKAFDPKANPLSFGLWLSPETPNGVALSVGGQSHGFALYLDRGVPCFAIRSSGAPSVVRGNKPLTLGHRTHVACVLTGDPKLRLYVNGKLAGEASTPGFVNARPNEGLTLGGDPASAVGDYAEAFPWRGELGALELYWGEVDEKTIRGWVRKGRSS